jgi:hypothetical protein
MAMAAMATRGLAEDRLRAHHRSPLRAIATPSRMELGSILSWDGLSTHLSQYPSTPRALQVYTVHRPHACRPVSALYLIPILHGDVA